MKNRIYGSLILGLLFQMSGCGFLESASELTFAEEQIPVLENEFQYPSVDEIAGLNEQSERIPGFPSSLNQSTLAHLVGSLSAQGECSQKIDLAEGGANSSLISASFELSACTEDQRCKAQCPEGFYGLNAYIRIKMKALTKEQTQEISEVLSKDNANAIVQIRLKFSKLEFFQGQGADYQVTNQWVDGFELNIGTQDLEPIYFLDQTDFEQITASTVDHEDTSMPDALRSGFERYELPRNHPVTEALITQLLSGEDFILDFEQRFRFPREVLYLMQLSPAGMSQVIQPEVVINAIDVATSSL